MRAKPTGKTNTKINIGNLTFNEVLLKCINTKPYKKHESKNRILPAPQGLRKL